MGLRSWPAHRAGRHSRRGLAAWPGIASIDNTFLDYWKAKSVDVSPFVDEAENTTYVETLPVAPEAAQVIISLASDPGPAWLGDEPATAADDANQELQHPSQ